ncbi:N-alpha-acetyl diaminobutyric acid deacetylase DoeB [Benzoatithermus flavus]|uniref:Succinylglutamate desuccinylase/aspartoacylase family protein n=1 Tax=Benzoatithermus flavus TaxID=3108223 RepID=A0ABU8XTS2_9PROT
MSEESRVSCTIDLDAPGKRAGYLNVPWSRNDSAWGAIRIPIHVICGGDGPTVLFTGANHGDEYEGPIALLKLARRLDPTRVRGRVIVLPTMNHPAVQAGTRVSPIDGVNMNRSFPGRRDGTQTPMLAHYVYHHLVARADVVVDLHSGGKTLDFVPSVVMHELDDKDLMERTRAAILAMGAPLALVLKELDTAGMLDSAVEELGKLFVTTELGGGGSTTPERVAIADRAVHNLLCHLRVLDEAPSAAPGPSRFARTPEDGFVVSDDAGLFEPLVELGAPVETGQPLGRVHFFEEIDREPRTYTAPRGGFLYCRHFPGLIKRGDCLAVLGDYGHQG